jgi:hypothetical protein
MEKTEAEQLINTYEGQRPASLDLLLEYLEMSEEEFQSMVGEMAVAPNKPFFESIPVGKRTHDFDSWYREAK